jgi:hypothetical protein
MAMALSKTPSPEGLLEHSRVIQPGTLPRIPSQVPGPIGLWFKPKFPMAPNALAPHQLGLTIHQKSQIKAQDWVKKINASDDVPDYFKVQIKAKGDVIYLTSTKKFKVPTNVISKDWLEDWLSAFSVEEWEMTTGCLDFSVKKGDSAGPVITIVHNPDLATGEPIEGFTKFTMTVNSRSAKSLSIERGNTLPTGVTLKSGRKLIAIANRIALTLGDKTKTFKFEDYELIETWFHEIACHAGRNSTGKPDVHGDKEVDSYAKDIMAMFPKATTATKAFDEVQEFLNGDKDRPK